jgi:aromatic-L-amino-acid decarboxylase
VIASAGTTDVGAVDPLAEVGRIAKDADCWYHIDAAYGGFFMLLEEMKSLFEGAALSDSIVLDPHKGLFLPFGTGAVLVKNKQHLLDSHFYMANYLQDTHSADEELSPADLSPELTKHFRGLRMWLPLKLHGLAPFKAALAEKLELCRYFYEKVQEIPSMEVGPPPELSVCYFRYLPENGDPNDFNKELLQLIHQDGRVFMSSTTLDSKFLIRVAVLSFRTHLATIDLALEIIGSNVEKINQAREAVI